MQGNSTLPDSISFFSSPPFLASPNSFITFVNVGTSASLKFSTSLGLKGTQMLPVLGWTQKGDFNRWFIPVDTLASKRG
jgi:hypothetical protein